MTQSVTYFADQNLVYLDYNGHIRFIDLSARVAEWMIKLNIQEDYDVLMDMRAIKSVDRPGDGMEEFLAMQGKLHRSYRAARKMAIVAPTPEGFTFARVFEQMSEGQAPTEVEIFREDQEALGFLSKAGRGIDELLAGFGGGTRLV